MRLVEAVNALLWHDAVLYTLLGVGLLFTAWSGLGQYRALTHGVAVLSGRYDRKGDPGAISHFQALSAALSATVGLGNIAGVAIAVSLGGPGAVFWMWVTGFIGMALKMTEVTQAMLHRNIDDPRNPHGGAMWVARRGMARLHPRLGGFGTVLGAAFAVTLLVSTFTGGNMFQAWNVADITLEYFGVPLVVTGLIQMLLVGAVIVGGIRRIGVVAGRLVPVMCGAYLLGSLYVLIKHAGSIPDVMRSIVVHAFAPHEAQGAFVGAAFGWVFLLGMRRALFSNEAGQGSAPIAHAAARTDEPVREGVVAGLEPFIDTLVVCTITALVILLSGVWSRPPDLPFGPSGPPAVVQAAHRPGANGGGWTLQATELPSRPGNDWREGQQVFVVIGADEDPARQSDRHRLRGVVERDRDRWVVAWETYEGVKPPTVTGAGVWREYKGATLTARAFDRTLPGLGLVIVPAVAWLFALSTMISWSYYGEQGAVYLFGSRSATVYRIAYCLLILVASSPWIRTESELDALSSLGTGLMLAVNVPIMLLFGPQAMREYRGYIRRLVEGAFDDRPASR